jgi:hypothetical protein
MEEKEKADEYIIGKDGELIGIAWSEDNPKKLPIAELKADGSFYLDGAKIRAVQSYTIEGLRTDTRDAILTLKILVDPLLLTDLRENCQALKKRRNNNDTRRTK